MPSTDPKPKCYAVLALRVSGLRVSEDGKENLGLGPGPNTNADCIENYSAGCNLKH